MTTKNNELISVILKRDPGMDFVRFEDDTVFPIEDSTLYQRRKQHVKMAEFLLLKRANEEEAATIFIIEAKLEVSPDENSDKAKTTVASVSEKFFNALALTLIGIAGRCDADESIEIPNEFRNIDWNTANFRFLLVIKNCSDRLLYKYRDSLSDASRTTGWKRPHHAVQSMLDIKYPEIYVLNEKLAREYKFIR